VNRIRQRAVVQGEADMAAKPFLLCIRRDPERMRVM